MCPKQHTPEATGTDHLPDLDPSGLADRKAAARIAELETELGETKDRLLRALADQENIRRQVRRERDDAVKHAVSGFAGDLLKTADTLQRAIASVSQEQVADDSIRQLVSGIAATERELMEVLNKHGIRRIEPLGQPFDPSFHQALFRRNDTRTADGTVIDVLQPGYLHHDRLLRPALVGVSTVDDDDQPS